MNVEKANKKGSSSEAEDAAGQKSEDLFPTKRRQRHCRLSWESMYDVVCVREFLRVCA